ncbi:hypothetical protein KFE25_005534 [Diacronema lutheri]|uniref:Uncharacterized protein n=1 Tax=Diacronema lutheri TaxID=2081491 RepID=A0A8J5XSX7_DIALT|nr:hypothetical protein KFE25_005534 [Diacronema lutheri]
MHGPLGAAASARDVFRLLARCRTAWLIVLAARRRRDPSCSPWALASVAALAVRTAALQAATIRRQARLLEAAAQALVDARPARALGGTADASCDPDCAQPFARLLAPSAPLGLSVHLEACRRAEVLSLWVDVLNWKLRCGPPCPSAHVWLRAVPRLLAMAAAVPSAGVSADAIARALVRFERPLPAEPPLDWRWVDLGASGARDGVAAVCVLALSRADVDVRPAARGARLLSYAPVALWLVESADVPHVQLHLRRCARERQCTALPLSPESTELATRRCALGCELLRLRDLANARLSSCAEVGRHLDARAAAAHAEWLASLRAAACARFELTLTPWESEGEWVAPAGCELALRNGSEAHALLLRAHCAAGSGCCCCCSDRLRALAPPRHRALSAPSRTASVPQPVRALVPACERALLPLGANAAGAHRLRWSWAQGASARPERGGEDGRRASPPPPALVRGCTLVVQPLGDVSQYGTLCLPRQAHAADRLPLCALHLQPALLSRLRREARARLRAEAPRMADACAVRSPRACLEPSDPAPRALRAAGQASGWESVVVRQQRLRAAATSRARARPAARHPRAARPLALGDDDDARRDARARRMARRGLSPSSRPSAGLTPSSAVARLLPREAVRTPSPRGSCAAVEGTLGAPRRAHADGGAAEPPTTPTPASALLHAAASAARGAQRARNARVAWAHRLCAHGRCGACEAEAATPMLQAMAVALRADADEGAASTARGRAAASAADADDGCALCLVSADGSGCAPGECAHDAGELLSAQRAHARGAYVALASALCDALDGSLAWPHEPPPSAAAAEAAERALCARARRAADALAALSGAAERALQCETDVLEGGAAQRPPRPPPASVDERCGVWAVVRAQLATHDDAGALAASVECALLLRVWRLHQLSLRLRDGERARASAPGGERRRGAHEQRQRLLARECHALRLPVLRPAAAAFGAAATHAHAVGDRAHADRLLAAAGRIERLCLVAARTAATRDFFAPFDGCAAGGAHGCGARQRDGYEGRARGAAQSAPGSELALLAASLGPKAARACAWVDETVATLLVLGSAPAGASAGATAKADDGAPRGVAMPDGAAETPPQLSRAHSGSSELATPEPFTSPGCSCAERSSCVAGGVCATDPATLCKRTRHALAHGPIATSGAPCLTRPSAATPWGAQRDGAHSRARTP